MNRTLAAFSLVLFSALFSFAGVLTLVAVLAQQTGERNNTGAPQKSSDTKQTPAAAPATQAPARAAANTKPATTTKPAPANTSAAKVPAPSTTPASKPAAAQQTPPANTAGMVWVNTDSGIHHKPGTRYYGKTKQGKYMTEADAIKAGYRPAGKN